MVILLRQGSHTVESFALLSAILPLFLPSFSGITLSQEFAALAERARQASHDPPAFHRRGNAWSP